MMMNDQEQTPLGVVLPFAGADTPRGWMLCEGTEISRTLYPDLFNIIGITYGQGDGTNTFNLPDLPPLAPGIRYIICSGRD
jgi:microcystin-dependent protein